MANKQTPRHFLLLPCYDCLQNLQTKTYNFSLLEKRGAASPTVTAILPDFLAELTFRRGAISAWLHTLPTSSGAHENADVSHVPDVVIKGLMELASRMEGISRVITMTPEELRAHACKAAVSESSSCEDANPATAAGSAAVTMGLVRSEWTSALSSKPQRFLKLECLPQEIAMVYSTYAAALRHAALKSACCNEGTAAAAGQPEASPAVVADVDSTGPRSAAAVQAALTAAVAGLRRAAGVYRFLADELLPVLSGTGATVAGDRPLELLPAGARCLQQLCLAEAQVLVAAVAEMKGMSYGTQRALHAGAANLFRTAAMTARDLATAAPCGLPASDRLTSRLMAASEALHSARAHVNLALDRQEAMQLGVAEVACEEALRLLDSAARRVERRADPPTWLDTIQAEQAACTALCASIQKDRLAVTFQSLPKQPTDALTTPVISVSPDAFRPTLLMPPTLPPDVEDKSKCVVI